MQIITLFILQAKLLKNPKAKADSNDWNIYKIAPQGNVVVKYMKIRVIYKVNKLYLYDRIL